MSDVQILGAVLALSIVNLITTHVIWREIRRLQGRTDWMDPPDRGGEAKLDRNIAYLRRTGQFPSAAGRVAR